MARTHVIFHPRSSTHRRCRWLVPLFGVFVIPHATDCFIMSSFLGHRVKSRTSLHAESNDVIETTNGTLATNKKKKKFAEFNVGDEVEVVEISRAGQKPRSIRLTWRCAKLRLKFTIAVDAENHECVRLVHWLLILFARLLQHMPPRLERPEVSDESIAHVTHSIQSKLAAKMIDAVILAVTVGLDVPVHS